MQFWTWMGVATSVFGLFLMGASFATAFWSGFVAGFAVAGFGTTFYVPAAFDLVLGSLDKPKYGGADRPGMAVPSFLHPVKVVDARTQEAAARVDAARNASPNDPAAVARACEGLELAIAQEILVLAKAREAAQRIRQQALVAPVVPRSPAYRAPTVLPNFDASVSGGYPARPPEESYRDRPPMRPEEAPPSRSLFLSDRRKRRSRP
jgi:hypothetical protein